MNRKRNTRKLDYGNWFESQKNDNPRKWSRRALEAMSFSATEHLGELVDDKDLPLASGIIKMFPKHEEVRAANLAKALAQDVYRLKVLPYPLGKQMMQSKLTLAAMGRDLEDCLGAYQKYNLIYSGGEMPFPDELYEDLIVLDNPEVALTQRRIGMPVIMYLLWLKGDGEKVRRGALMEWSGIPVRRQDYVYEQLLESFRVYLENEHKAAEKYSQPLQFQTSGVNISCRETAVYNF